MIARLRKKDSFTSRLRKANEKVKSRIKREQFHKRQKRKEFMSNLFRVKVNKQQK